MILSRKLCKSKMIILICINHGFPEPLVEADDERTYFSVTLNIHPDFGKRQSGDMINLKLNEKRLIKMGPTPETQCYVRPEWGLQHLQALPDDPHDGAHGHAPLHVQTGDGKGNVILLAGHPVVVAGVGYSVLGASLSIFSLTHRDLRLKGRNAPISVPNCANYLPAFFSADFGSGKNCSSTSRLSLEV